MLPVSLKCNNDTMYIHVHAAEAPSFRQVQKSDWINSDCQSRSDKLRLYQSNLQEIQLEEMKTFVHLKDKISH